MECCKSQMYKRSHTLSLSLSLSLCVSLSLSDWWESEIIDEAPDPSSCLLFDVIPIQAPYLQLLIPLHHLLLPHTTPHLFPAN
jgi:hypothetical protein